MGKIWRQFKTRDKLIVLILFAVLLPTVLLLLAQYYSLQELRGKNRLALENSLRQSIQRIDDDLENQLSEIGYASLQSFDNIELEPWQAEKVNQELNRILREHPAVESVFVVSTDSDGTSRTALASIISGYREHEGNNNTDNAFFNDAEQESLTVSYVAVVQASANNRNGFFFVPSQCEKCPPDAAGNTEKFYLYRPLSNPRDLRRLRFAGASLKRDFIVHQMLPGATAALERDAAQNQTGSISVGVFDEHQKLIYSNAEDAAPSRANFEVQIPLGQSFARWTVAASYRANKIDELSTIYFRRNLLLLVLMASLLVVGILLVLRMTAKEMELAAAKAAFVSNVSHELKTPLSLIRLFVELLETNRIEPEKWSEYLNVISKETRRLTELINNILDFAAIEAGRKQYRFAPENLTTIVSDVLQNYSLVLNESGFTVKTHFSEQLPLVEVDRAAIEQAVLNLLNNAVKYSPQEKHIEITVNRADAETVKIAVSDRGAGISLSEQKKIFEKFYRSGGTNDVHNVKGSGLGLSLVKHIVEAHRGGIMVQSEKGKGSTFTLWLPINSEVN